MKQRCYSHNKRNFADYGGRGIMVCERWRNSFENFLADMGPRPTPLHSIDRIDNSLGYDPANCRWATRTEQNRNKRSNRYMTMNGRTMILTDWAIETGIKRETIKERIRRGWTISRALTTPPRPQKQCSR